MSAKDKIIFGVLVVLVGVAVYFQFMATDMITRMDELNKNDAEHVDVIHNEFRKDLPMWCDSLRRCSHRACTHHNCF